MEPVDIGALKALGPRAVWVRIPPRALRRQRTTTTAFMNGWKSQWYGNRPGVEKVTDLVEGEARALGHVDDREPA